ncbi:nicotinic acid mononucleotide adenyltransferase [Aquimarina sp. 2201CG5-10]|uniref:toxin-antitoxin system YwqK family antitoxin n=1 Tax=Aquimarina callyspongiae TaxID=3098150 RepID=UPI002AB5CA3D|nr:nicotinic acid mononucleotide adenyltransferase [Aquimarina sp. 2201CG5-10]MDY8134966.1 nicotinic acid mononucleotide adenyltransferase [Aquimarina sp. 2201CG5-10]
MKKTLVAIAIIFSATMMAQDVKPTFQKEGNLVKGTFFHDNGKIRQQGFYKDGKLHGEWKSYDTTGKKIAMGQYNSGVKTGKWFFWNNGKLSEVNYADNTIASVTTWSNKDNVVVNYNKN